MSKAQAITIGTTLSGYPVKLSIQNLIDSRMLIQANSGGGKSWLLRLIAERAASKVQLVILDPEGEFGTLREKLDIALVGQGGEIAADVRSAALLARKLAELRFNAVIDLYELKLSDRRKYVRLFLESLMSIPRSLWHPMLVILDEAHMFAPEKAHGEAESLGAVISLMSQGRKRGIAGLLATQRLGKLAKDACEVNTVFIGRTWLDVDQDRAAKILGLRAGEKQVLRDNPPGQFFAFGPALNTSGVTVINVGEVQTTHPKAGQRHLMQVPQSSNMIKGIIEQLGDLPKQVEEDENAMALAKRRIFELERQLSEVNSAPAIPSQPVVQRVPILALQDGESKELMDAVQLVAMTQVRISEIAKRISAALDAVPTFKSIIMQNAANQVPESQGPKIEKPTGRYQGLVNGLRAGEKRMLQVLASRYPVKYSRAQLGTLAGYAARGGTFGNYFSTLKKLGFVIEDSVGVQITQAGLDHLGTDIPVRPQSHQDVIEMWRAALRRGERVMFDCLLKAYPNTMTRQQLGEMSGFSSTGGTFGNYLSTLRRNGLVNVNGGNEVWASTTLFDPY